MMAPTVTACEIVMVKLLPGCILAVSFTPGTWEGLQLDAVWKDELPPIHVMLTALATAICNAKSTTKALYPHKHMKMTDLSTLESFHDTGRSHHLE